MDQILTDLGLEQLIPAFNQHKITVQNFDYLLKNNCPGGPLSMIMDQTGLVIGDLLTIMERIEKTSHIPLVHRHMLMNNQYQQRQPYPRSTNLTSSYGRQNRISKLLSAKPQPKAYQSMTKMMPKSQQNAANLDSFLGIDNRQNSSRKDSMNPFDQRNMHPVYPKQAPMVVKEEQAIAVEQQSEESVQIQQVVDTKQEHHQVQASELITQEIQNTGQIESIVENTITEEEKQILQNKASQDYLHEKLKSLSQQQDGHSEDQNDLERKFMPRKISSPDYEASNMSDQFQNAVKLPEQKTFENNAPILNDNKDAFDCDDSQEDEPEKEDLVGAAERMMKAAKENAAKETVLNDIEEQESYSEVGNDKDQLGEKFKAEPHNQQISTNVQFKQVPQQQRQEVDQDTSELDEDEDDESNSEMSDDKPKFNANSAFNRRPTPQYTQPQMTSGHPYQSQHQSRPTIGVKQPVSFSYRNQKSQQDELAKLQRQMEEKQMEIRKMKEQQDALNAKMSDHENEEESSLESLEEPKHQEVQQNNELINKNVEQVSDDSYGTEQDEEMEIQKAMQDKVSNAHVQEDKDIDDDEDLPSDSEFNKKAEQRKAEVSKNIARQSQWASGHVVTPQPPSQDQNAYSSSANQQYFEDSPQSEENFASQIHAENLQRSQEQQQLQSQQLMQQCKMTSENTNTFLVGTSESQNNFYPPSDVLKQQPQQSQLNSSGQKFDNPIMVDQQSSSFAQQTMPDNFNLNLVQMQNTMTSQHSVKNHQQLINFQNQQTIISPQKVMQPLHQQISSSSNHLRNGEQIQRPNILQSELQERNSMLQHNEDCDPHQQIMSEIKQSQNFQEFQAPQQFSTNIHNQIASSYNSSSALKHNLNTSQHNDHPSQSSNVMKYDQYAQIDIKPKQHDMQVQNELLTPDHVNNLKSKLRSELRSEVQEEVRAELHHQVEREVINKVRQQVEFEITSQVTERVTNEVSQRVKMQVEQEKQQQLQKQIQEIQAKIYEEERNKFESEKSEQQRKLQEYQLSIQSEKAKFHEIIQQKEHQISQFKTQEESNQTLVQRLNDQLNRLNDERQRADQNVQYLQTELEKEKQAKLFEAQQAQIAQQKADQEKARLEALERKRLQDEAEQQRMHQESQAQYLRKEAEAAALQKKLEEQQRLQQLEKIQALKKQQEIYNQQILEKQRIEAALQQKQEEEAERLRKEAFEERQRQEQERQKEEALARMEAIKQQAAKQEAIRQENLRKQKEQEMAILKRQQQEQAAAIQKRLEEEAAQKRAEEEENARKEAELRAQEQHLQELKRKAEEDMRRVQEENLRIHKQQQEQLELKRQQMMELQKQKEQAEVEEQQRIEEQEVLKKQAELEAALQEKKRIEEELIEKQRLEGQKLLMEKQKQEELQNAEFQLRMQQEQENMRQLQEKQEQLKILIEEKEKREEEERRVKAEQIAQSNEKQSQEVITHSSMIKAQQEMLLDLEQKKQKLEKENQQMQEKLQRSSQMSQLSDRKSVSDNLDQSQNAKDVNVINLDEDLEDDQPLSASKQKYFQQLREESSFLPDVVKVQKEKKKIIKKVRFHDYPASAEKDSSLDENDDDSDFEVRVSPKKRRFVERIEELEDQEAQDAQDAQEDNFEEDCDRDFERIQQKQMHLKKLRSTGMCSDQEKQDNSFASEQPTVSRRRLQKKFSEDDTVVSAEEAPKKQQIKRKQKQNRKSTGTSKSTSPAPETVTAPSMNNSQYDNSYTKPKKSSKSIKNYDQKIIQHIEKAENPVVKQNKHLMDMLKKIAGKK